MSKLTLALLLLVAVLVLSAEGHRRRHGDREGRHRGRGMLDRMGRRRNDGGLNQRRARRWMSRFCTDIDDDEPRDIVGSQLSNPGSLQGNVGMAAAGGDSDDPLVTNNRHDMLTGRGRGGGRRIHMGGRRGLDRMEVRRPRMRRMLCRFLTENQCTIPGFLNCSNDAEPEEEEDVADDLELDNMPLVQ